MTALELIKYLQDTIKEYSDEYSGEHNDIYIYKINSKTGDIDDINVNSIFDGKEINKKLISSHAKYKDSDNRIIILID